MSVHATHVLAQPESSLLTEAPSESLSPSALPGLHRVATAHAVAPGLAFAISAGYGFTESVLRDDTAHHRARGILAVSYRPTAWLAAGLELDGHYDRHSLETGTDQSFISDPRLFARVMHSLGPIDVALHGTVWLPGDSPADATLSAATADAKLVVSKSFGTTLFAANFGYRLDRSAKSVQDPNALSDSDRLSLGVSDSDALLFGFGGTYPLSSSVSALGELTWDVLTGDDAPAATSSPIRLSGGVRWAANNSVSLDARIDLSPQKRPIVARGEPLVPIEPLVGFIVGLSVRFGSDVAEAPPKKIVIDVKPEVPDKPKPAAATATIKGRVVDPRGKAIVGAQVRVTATPRFVLLSSDGGGKFVSGALPEGNAIVEVEADGFKPRKTEVPLKNGETLDVDFILEPAVPQGQLRGAVHGYDGKPVQATISIMGLDIATLADEEGAFELSIPAGEHEVTVTADGFKTQTRTVVVEDNGVTVLNADLRKKRRRRR
jgi:hypothetical protein